MSITNALLPIQNALPNILNVYYNNNKHDKASLEPGPYRPIRCIQGEIETTLEHLTVQWSIKDLARSLNEPFHNPDYELTVLHGNQKVWSLTIYGKPANHSGLKTSLSLYSKGYELGIPPAEQDEIFAKIKGYDIFAMVRDQAYKVSRSPSVLETIQDVMHQMHSNWN